MKFLVFWSINYDNWEKAMEKYMAEPQGWEPKAVFTAHQILGSINAVGVYEAESLSQMQKFVAFFMPEVSAEVLPLIEPQEGLKIWEMMKK
jgi:hypothetical protein